MSRRRSPSRTGSGPRVRPWSSSARPQGRRRRSCPPPASGSTVCGRSRSAGRSRCDPPPRRSWRSVRSAAARPIVRDASVVLGMGGYASVAPVLAARSLRVPTVVHEQNAVPGLANRFLARTVTAVALTFASSRARLPASVRAAITGLPLRREVLSVATDRASLVEEARGAFGLQTGRTTVLVTGGSQGALHVDRTIAGAIPLLAGRADLQMLVLTRRREGDRWSPTPLRARWTSSCEPSRPSIGWSSRSPSPTSPSPAPAPTRSTSWRSAASRRSWCPTRTPPMIISSRTRRSCGTREPRRSSSIRSSARKISRAGSRRSSTMRISARRWGRRPPAWATPDADERVAALVTSVARS